MDKVRVAQWLSARTSPSILSETIVGFTAGRRSPGGAVPAFEPPLRSQAPRCARSHGGPANLCQRWRRVVSRKAGSHYRAEIRGGRPAELADFMTLDISRYTRLAQDMGLGED
jgi:hypothetical protein